MSAPRFKIFADPVHGFISVPRNLILELVKTPEVQRLRRIRQLGVGDAVFPGGEHTRFGHALGAMALMQEALYTLAEKGTPISEEEHTAALTAALLHDIGHGPFSHTLEHDLIFNFEHESMSRALILQLNERFNRRLDLALAIFDNTYHRPFFHQLVSSQLDMDRMDYLRRDSFYTGVAEGKIGVQRIIKTMRVEPLAGLQDAHVVMETKGVYAVENFLFARRLMYWQVYLHKTVVAGDLLLKSIFQRARTLIEAGQEAVATRCSPALSYFLMQRLEGKAIGRVKVREAFCELDDSDVLFSIKRWARSHDPILADLSRRFIQRDFFRVQYLPYQPDGGRLSAWQQQVAQWLIKSGLSSHSNADQDRSLYLKSGISRNSAYTSQKDPIHIISKDGVVQELSEMADTSAISALTQQVEKHYIFFPKEVLLHPVP